MTHRRFLAALAALAVLAVAPAAHAGLSAQVDTTMGTDEGAQDFGTGGGAGATFPGPVAPGGMIQFSPDTVPGTRNFAGGYAFPDTRMRGFSLTHLSGAGCASLGDVPILPTNAAITSSPSTFASFDVAPRYLAALTHDGEVAAAGDYRVRLGSEGARIAAELTATLRTGAARFTFPEGGRPSILFNAGGSALGNLDADFEVDPERREVRGTVSSGAFCFNPNRYRVHVVARFDRPFAAHGTWVRQTVRPGGTRATDRASRDQIGILGLQYKPIPGGPAELPGNPSSGAQAGAYVTFDSATDRDVEVQVGMSFVSREGARENLEAEQGRFGDLRARAQRTWDDLLGRARVRGGSPEDRRLFVTLLHRALIGPTVVSDVDGRYPGLDGRARVARGHRHLSHISGWDVYRTQVPLLALLDPERARDLARTLLADFADVGHLPKWPIAGDDTNVMVGDPADVVLAGLRAFGATDFDATQALRATVKGATTPGASATGYVQRPGLQDLLRVGFVGFERNTDVLGHTLDPSLVWGSSATTLEYATADHAIARLARAAGDGATCATFAARADRAWRSVIDPVTGFARGRYADGRWATGDPTSDSGFVEGSAAQYTWAVPQDAAGLVAHLGGRERVAARLETFFGELNAGVRSDKAFLGNEPNLLTPALATWVGRPDLTSRVVRRAMRELYRRTPGGYPGNDDLGAMSSWWVLGALGLLPAVPGEGVLTLHAPLFPRADLRLPRGTLTILAAGEGEVVRSATFDGARHDRPWLSWDVLSRGGVLEVVRAGAPGGWGTGPQAEPPSFGPGCAARPSSGPPTGRLRVLRRGRVVRLAGGGTGRVTSVRWRLGRRVVVRRSAPFAARVRRGETVRAEVLRKGSRRVLVLR